MERPVATGCLVVPNVIEVDGGRLHWDIDDDRPIEQPEPGQGMLNEFIALQDADDGQIGAYALRWGTLGICPHGKPISHAAFTDGMVFGTRCRLLREETRFYAWEPLERWRYFSRQAGAILNLAARLHTDQPGRPEDWRQVIFPSDGRPVPWWKRFSSRLGANHARLHGLGMDGARERPTGAHVAAIQSGPAGAVRLRVKRWTVSLWNPGLPTYLHHRAGGRRRGVLGL